MSEPSVRLVDDPHLVGPGARAWLESHGVHTNVAATILAGELAGPRRYDDQSWALVEDAGELVGVAVETSPHDALVPPIGATAAAAVAQAWHAVGRPLPGVVGNDDSGGAFARRWSDLTGASAEATLREGGHVLGTFVPADGVPGSGRTATPADLDAVLAWLTAFVEEALPGHPDPPRDEVLGRIRHGRHLLWEAGGVPVSLAVFHEPVGRLGRIGAVYTPPGHRRPGDAAAVTTLASRRVLDAGARPMLHTDLANPTSNGVYARLGFEQVGELTRWAFSGPGR